ncbi:MAG: glutamine synthetase type III [Spirochaetaceae bacterium]|nr:MAG: glutamine synthetase type III [Spirochaetaceae bacterium]
MERIIDFTKKPVTEIYGSHCFNDAVMKERLQKTVYKAVKNIQEGKAELTLEIADIVAMAMKDWAIENGATHFTHWFQPLTGLTAEKHDSFISPTQDGKVNMEFSGKELIKGEPDASSFPSGGLRSTFEARGYTAWDTTSPAFLKEDNTGVTLYIPTAFISFTGEALDKKVPLLRSMEALSKQAMRVLRALGNTTSERVVTTVGPEQEYFLVDKEYWEQRPDLMLSGRTLFGSMPSKGQELEDHYFGSIKERVADFMRELNFELWKLGISAKTQHNEVAPNQFELAPIFDVSNVAADRNQLVMETMQKVAGRHGLVALLHEKPFAGVNGSGKHNNWSMGTNDGQNLLDPGANPSANAQFLLFLSAVLKAVDTYSSLLRVSAANPGNDHRLGANEAPPAIVSVFLGEQLEEILSNLAEGKPAKNAHGQKLQLGVSALPLLPKDLTDRNRTSPFAFTGNKFEFRMVPSSESIAEPNVVLNSIVADILMEIADMLEKSADRNKSIQEYVINTYKKHHKIIFNGNNYSEDWLAEAEKRGLPNIRATVDALPVLVEKSTVELFGRHRVYTKKELESRFHISLERYSKQINIEAQLMISMATRDILPSCVEYMATLAGGITGIKGVVVKAATGGLETLLADICTDVDALKMQIIALEKAHIDAQKTDDVQAQALVFREKVFPAMAALREPADRLERLVAREYWPFPTYEDLLFRL